MKEHVKLRGKTWTYWIDAGKDDSGRRRQTTKGGFTTEAEARAAARKALVQIEQDGSFVPPSRERLAPFLRRWLKSQHLKPSTLSMYTSMVESHIVPRLGDIELRKLNAAQLNAFYSGLLTSGRRMGKAKGTGLAPITVSKVHAVLHKALAAGVKWGDLTRNVSEQADPPSGRSQAQMRIWTAEELSRFLAFTAGERLATAYLVLATTGLRRGELLGLRWKDLDLPKARLSVVQTVVSVDYKVQLSTPKTAAGRRSVALDSTTVEYLQAHRRHQMNERSNLGLPWPGTEAFVFADIDGAPLHPDGFSDRFDRLVRRSGLPRITVHDLRHTHATLALQAGIPAKVVSERLGHANVSMTLDIYSHVIPAMQEDAAERVAGLIFAPASKSG
ncbi:MAG: tyrosine-type recombinase/integrase [Dehalococcoidia bacterium]